MTQPQALQPSEAVVDVPAITPRNKIQKSPSAFRTISEVAETLKVPQHVLRFWETKFSQIRPLKRGGNRRYYRPEDVTLLERIHNLLYTEGYTIKGVQKLLKAQRGVQTVPATPVVQPPASARAAMVVAEPAITEISAEIAEVKTPRDRATLTDRQRITLKEMLGELKELRSLIPQ